VREKRERERERERKKVFHRSKEGRKFLNKVAIWLRTLQIKNKISNTWK
jgi:hypothetical protein